MSEGKPASHDNVTNLPATREIREVRVASPGTDLITIARQTQQIRELGQTLIASGLLPDSIKKPETAVAIMIKGQELDIGPMYALSHISIIKGKPALSAELMGALVKRAGHTIRVVTMNEKGCTVEGIRRDDPAHKARVIFTEADARRAGLLNQSNYQKYPQDLYRSRAISRLCRSEFQDAIMGMSYTPEELGAEVDEEGQVLSVPEASAPPAPPAELRNEDSEEVVEAEVVEEGPPAREPDILKSQIGRIENLSKWIWGEKRAVEKKVLKGHRIEELTQESAKSVISGLQKTKEKIEAQESGEDAETEAEDTGDTGEEPTAGAPQPGSIRDEQYERLVAVLDELFPDEDDEGVSGHRRYEKEYLAQPIPALTEARAKEILGWAEEQLAKKRASAGDQKPKGELPATKKQLNFLEALIVDVVEDGVGRFEEMVGKPMGELTRDEASEWIERLRGRAT